jgi:hypothetical protein
MNLETAIQKSKTLKKLADKETPFRIQELYEIGVKKDAPKAGICCGSNCDPCNLVLHKQEMRVWKELQEVLAKGEDLF